MKAINFGIIAVLVFVAAGIFLFSSGNFSDITAKIISFEDYARPCAGDSCKAQDVPWENISSIPDQSTPILDLGSPELNIAANLDVSDITGWSPARVLPLSMTGMWFFLLIILICITGIGSAISYYIESHMHTGKKEEKKETPLRGDEIKLLQLIEKARKIVFENIEEAEKLYFQINEIYKELPAEIQDKYYDKIMLLYDKIILQIKKMQMEEALSVKQTEKANTLMKEIEDLYSIIREKEPERKIPALDSGAKKDYELTVNKIHDLIISAKQDLNQDVELAKEKIEQIVLLLNQLPVDIQAKFQYDVDNLKELVKNS